MSTSTDQARHRRAGERLFGHLPLDLFRPLSGPQTRIFYADLLEHLEAEVFSWSAAVVPQAEVLDAIKEFVDRQGRGVPLEEEAGVASSSGSQDSRAHIAYRRLLDTGWLVEHRDRYRRVVDFDGHARIVLQLLLDIKSGRTRSYGGEVLGVLSNLDAAHSDPRNKSEGVRNAAKASRSFMSHLRSIASTMRTIEQEISATNELVHLFRRFFDDFVAEHLVEDYKRLHTDSNPFRFSVRILEVCEQMLGETLLLDSLAEGYVLEGRASNAADARAVIEEEIRTIMKIFDALDEHLQMIDAVNRRIEARVRNTVRHMERIADADTEGVVAAMQALGRLNVTTVPAGPLPVIQDLAPIGQAQLFQNARKRIPPARRPIRKPAPDPAFLAFQEALTVYRERMLVTPDKVQAYLARAMAGRSEVRAADLPMNTLDDFIVFERLPLIRWMGDEVLAQSFSVQTIEGSKFSNPWISCADFIVRRGPFPAPSEQLSKKSAEVTYA